MKNILKKIIFTFCMTAFVLVSAVPVLANEDAAIQATAVSGKKIDLEWNMVNGASRYKVYRSTKSGGGFIKLDTVRETRYRDASVKGGTTYYYKIVPVKSSTKKDMEEAEMTVRAKTAKTVQVTKITVKSPTKAILYWDSSKGSNGYEVYRSNSKKGRYIRLETVKGKTNTAFTDKSIVPGKSYYYKIRPTVSNNGVAGKGSYSDPIQVKTVAKAKVTGITSVNSTTMRFTWKKIGNATGYEIYRSTKENGGYKKIATLGKGTLKYTDKSVKGGKQYYYKIVTLGKMNGKKITSGYSEPIGYRTLARVNISTVEVTQEDSIVVRWKAVKGAVSYKVYRATSAKGTYKKIATVKSDGKSIQSYTDKKISSDKKYYYKIQAYSSDDGLILAGKGDRSEYQAATTLYAIMGETGVTVDQMVKLYKSSGKKYPSIYADKGAKDIKKFCKIIMDESEKEGVKAEVIFAQVCLETGYLSFGGQVSPKQCNFSGIGATDDGAAGATFPDVKTGIRAQVQHLKGYASKESLNQKCVDPRFKYLTFRRGTTPYVQQLGNGNWATDPDYAAKLMTLIRKMLNY